MADPLSISASIAGLVSVTETVWRSTFTYIKAVRNAPHEVSKLRVEIGSLYGILTSLWLLTRQLETEKLDRTIQTYHIWSCHQTLEKIKVILDKHHSLSAPSKSLESVKAKLKWPFSIPEVENLIYEIQQHKSTLNLALAADGMSNLLLALSKQQTMQNSLDEIKDDLRKSREAETRAAIDKEEQKILDLIGRVNPHKNHEMSLKLRHPATGLWFTESSDFKQWLVGKGARLWLHGIPGAGKTILCSSIIEEARQAAAPISMVAFFYCDYKNAETQSPSNILGSLASQIAMKDKKSLGRLKEYYRKHNSDETTSRLHHPEDLRDLIVNMASDWKYIMIVVDALDECDAQTCDVVHLLASLSISRENCDIRTLVLSRSEQEIQEILVGFDQISIAAQGSDLKLYVAAQVEIRIQKRQLRIRDQSLKEHIVERLVTEADGMFRWVACQIDHLCELPTDADRRSALKSLPPTLNATYERILRQVSKANILVQNLVRRTLQWIVHAHRTLSISTLCDAIAVEPGNGTMKYDAIPSEDEVLRWCSSLVRKTSSGNSLELAHFTVKEFLVKLKEDPTSELAIYGLDKAHADINLGLVCLTVLLARDPVDDYDSLWYYAVMWWNYHAQYNMANSNVFSLTKQIMHPSMPERLILWAKEWRYHFLHEPSDDECLSTVGPLHFASLLALPQVCAWLIEQGCDVNEASRLGTPLHCALLGHNALRGQHMEQFGEVRWIGNQDLIEATVRVILSSGGDAQSTYNDAGRLRTPFYIALRLDNKAACIDMLRINAVLDHDWLDIINPENAYQILENVGEGRLSYANHAPLIASALRSKSYQLGNTFSALDRQQKFDHHLRDKYNECLWFAAKFRQVPAITQLLNDFQLNINVRDERNNFAALHYAAESGHVAAIEFLIQRGADHTIVDLEEKTPLSFVMRTVHSRDLTEYLKQLDINLSQKDKHGQALWHYAARNKNPDVLSTFTTHAELQHQVTAQLPRGESKTIPIECDQFIAQSAIYHNVQSHDGTRPLHIAAEAGSLEAVQFLLENGADVEARKLDGSNALHCAVDGDSHTIRADIVYILIERGLDPASLRLDKSTPLLILIKGPKRFRKSCAAAEYSVLRMLMQHKPALSVTDDDGLSVIHHICCLASECFIGDSPLESWEYRAFQLMLDNGAEMHHLDHAHRTPLEILLGVFREEYLHASKPGIKIPTSRARVCAKMINATYEHIGHGESPMGFWREPDLLVLALWVMEDELVDHLLQLGIDVDAKLGVTNLAPIQAACRFGCSASTMKVFITRSAHFSGPVSSVSSLVIEACDGQFRIKAAGHLEALLGAGCDPNSCSDSGTTALMMAAKAGNTEMMDLLIQAGADLSAMDNIRWTVIHHICSRILHNVPAVFQRLCIPSVGWISRVGIIWRDHKYSNITALHMAATHKSGPTLEELLDSGLVHALDATSDEGDTALMLATTIGELRNVKLLLSKGANANLVNLSGGQSALHIAAANGHRETASLLVSYGCDLSAKDFNDMTPAMCAHSNGHKKLAATLNSYPSSEDVIRSGQSSCENISADNQLAMSPQLRRQARVTRHQWLSRV